MLLEIDQLSVSYGAVHALHGVSLTVGEKEIVAVLGANGAGKSSLLSAVMGLVRPAAGAGQFDGKDLRARSTRDRIEGGLVLVPEGRRILVTMTVEENLLLGGAHRGGPAELRQEIDAVFELFPNLANRRSLPAATLSGGEQQMLAIGRALVAKPRLLMLDEPSLGLSPLFVSKVFEIIRGVNRDGTAVLLIEQNTRMALKVAHRAYVLQNGRVARAGNASELMADDDLSQAYLGAN